jgi:hypothetical protein
MLIYIILTLIELIAAFSIGFLRGAYKAGDGYMKAYIKFRERQGINLEDISKEVMEIFKIRKTL